MRPNVKSRAAKRRRLQGGQATGDPVAEQEEQGGADEDEDDGSEDEIVGTSTSGAKGRLSAEEAGALRDSLHAAHHEVSLASASVAAAPSLDDLQSMRTLACEVLSTDVSLRPSHQSRCPQRTGTVGGETLSRFPRRPLDSPERSRDQWVFKSAERPSICSHQRNGQSQTAEGSRSVRGSR